MATAIRKSDIVSNFGNVMVPDRILGEEIEDLEPGRALDLGCGTGANCVELARCGWRVYGVDIDEEKIESARRVCRYEELNAEFVVADIVNWEVAGEFDLVIMTYALPGGEANETMLASASRALAPGGVLLVADWDRSMATEFGMQPTQLPTPGQIREWLPDLTVDRAEVLRFSDMFNDADPRKTMAGGASVAFVRARRPE